LQVGIVAKATSNRFNEEGCVAELGYMSEKVFIPMDCFPLLKPNGIPKSRQVSWAFHPTFMEVKGEKVIGAYTFIIP